MVAIARGKRPYPAWPKASKKLHFRNRAEERPLCALVACRVGRQRIASREAFGKWWPVATELKQFLRNEANFLLKQQSSHRYLLGGNRHSSKKPALALPGSVREL